MSLNFIVETKDVDKKSDLRGTEEKRIAAAEYFFKEMSDANINVCFSPQLKRDDIDNLIRRVIDQN